MAPGLPKTSSPSQIISICFGHKANKSGPLFLFPHFSPSDQKNMNKFCSRENCKTVTFHLFIRFVSFESDSRERKIELVYQKSSKVIACKKIISCCCNCCCRWMKSKLWWQHLYQEPDRTFLRN